MKSKILFAFGAICISLFMNVDFSALKSSLVMEHLSLSDLALFQTADAECSQVWVDKDGDGIAEEYIYWCDDDDDPWYGEDDLWTAADYPCISSASGSFSVNWDPDNFSFGVEASGSYEVDHYVTKCGEGGDLTECWEEMC